jgi:hypothetical protein
VDGGFVADGELVVAGGRGPVAFEPVDAAFDGVPLFVGLAVEGGWPAAGAAPVLAVGDPVGWLGDGALDAASAQPGAVAAGPVGLAPRAQSGRVRARPGPSRGTAIWSRTVANWGLSPRCPAVMRMDRGFWPCPTTRWILVDRPPRDRPSP